MLRKGARMHRPTHISTFHLSILIVLIEPSANAGIVVLSGSGGVEARDYGASAFENVPWTQSGMSALSAQWRELSASGTLGFDASDDSLSLNFSGSHSVRRTVQESREEMSSSIGGGFWIMTDVDVLVSASGTASYSLHGQEDPAVGMFMEISNQNQDLIHQGYVTSSYGPPAGTIDFADSLLLDSGTQYFIFAGSELSQVAVGFSELPSIATSEMTFTIQAVPEPATLTFLVLAPLLALHRIRKILG